MPLAGLFLCLVRGIPGIPRKKAEDALRWVRGCSCNAFPPDFGPGLIVPVVFEFVPFFSEVFEDRVHIGIT